MPRKRKASRPHVTVNMAMSLDGKITTYRREDIVLGSKHDRRLMDVLRAEAGAVIVGAGTVKHDGHPILMRHKDLLDKRVSRGLAHHPINVVLSRKLDVPLTRPIFRHAATEKIVFGNGGYSIGPKPPIVYRVKSALSDLSVRVPSPI